MKLFNFLCQSSRKLKVGDFIKEKRIITQSEVDKFSDLCGDHNPIHKISDNNQPIIHGAFLNSIISGVIGTKFPGPGTIVLSQEFNFPKKCYPNEEFEILIEVLEARKIMKIQYDITQNNQSVFKGTANLLIK